MQNSEIELVQSYSYGQHKLLKYTVYLMHSLIGEIGDSSNIEVF